MQKKWMLMILLFPLLVFLAGYVVLSLWNWLVPALFNGPVISFIQALGLLLLSKILFGGFKGGRGWGGGSCYCGGGNYWKNKMHSRMEGMSEEEKEKFKEAFKNRCGSWGD